MAFIYYVFIKVYGLLIILASIFNKKARSWVQGRGSWNKKLKSALQHAGKNRIHFHCPSLGEYEQGKPVLESLRKTYPDYFIVLTFFSPSGYEIRKNEKLADYVCYLPLDGPFNARRFTSLLMPNLVFFVKYDFWHFYIHSYHSRKIPVIYISSVFRSSQIFFKWYGWFLKKILTRVNHFFVQDQESLELLYKNSITQVTVSGDTRFDRVFSNFKRAKEIERIERFKENKKVFVAGSTWPSDEALLKKLIEKSDKNWKFIIAPHEISEHKIKKLSNELPIKSIRYSKWEDKESDSKVLIIDSIGLLSSIYRYADIAYIGGGFGKGIHNILEAAVFGIPVIFGPIYKKFREANELLKLGGATTVRDSSQLIKIFDDLNTDANAYKKVKQINQEYIEKNRGASKIILDYVNINFKL